MSESKCLFEFDEWKMEEMLIMENAPNIILFWYFIIALFVLMIALMIKAIILIKKSKCKGQSSNKMLPVGKTCLVLSIICAIPIILVVGYILYLYIG